MSKPTRECILSNPRLVLSDPNSLDIELIKETLKVTAKQILCKFGYMQLNKDGLDKFTLEEVFYKMPDETKVMFWAVNNASNIFEIERGLRIKREYDHRLLSAEVLGYQLQIIELQIKLKQK